MTTKIIMFTILCLVFISCAKPRFTMGMEEKVFVKNNRVTLISSTQNTSVYRKINHPFLAPTKYYFFYFQNGRLKRMDGGVRNSDIIIENRTN